MAKLQAVDDHPTGYPQLAAFSDCDSRKFLMCRSFMYSRIRQLLYCQDELAQLQRGLLGQDDEDASIDDGTLLVSRKRYEYHNEKNPRKAFINKIGPKLKEYDDLVERTIRFASLRAPDARDLQGMKTWIEQERPLSGEERDHLLHGTDFVALVEKQEEGWLDKIVERALLTCFPRRDSIFTSPEQRRISDNPNLLLRSKHRIDVLIRIVLTITAASMLLGPSAVLYIVRGHSILKLLMIGAFTVLFSAALHAFSKARRHENFAATSAWVFTVTGLSAFVNDSSIRV